MKSNLTFLMIFLCIFVMSYSGYGFLSEPDISAGYRIFEDVRMASAGNGGIKLSEGDALVLSRFIESQYSAELQLHIEGFGLGLIFLILLVFQLVINSKRRKST